MNRDERLKHMIHYNGIYRMVRINPSDVTTVLYVADSPKGNFVKVVDTQTAAELIGIPVWGCASTKSEKANLRKELTSFAEAHGYELRSMQA